MQDFFTDLKMSSFWKTMQILFEPVKWCTCPNTTKYLQTRAVFGENAKHFRSVRARMHPMCFRLLYHTLSQAHPLKSEGKLIGKFHQSCVVDVLLPLPCINSSLLRSERVTVTFTQTLKQNTHTHTDTFRSPKNRPRELGPKNSCATTNNFTRKTDRDNKFCTNFNLM